MKPTSRCSSMKREDKEREKIHMNEFMKVYLDAKAWLSHPYRHHHMDHPLNFFRLIDTNDCIFCLCCCFDLNYLISYCLSRPDRSMSSVNELVNVRSSHFLIHRFLGLASGYNFRDVVVAVVGGNVSSVPMFLHQNPM